MNKNYVAEDIASSFFSNGEIEIIDETVVETEEGEVKQEEISTDDVEIVEDEEESEDVVEEEEKEIEELTPLQLYRSTASAFGQKFGFDFDEEAITDIETFGEFADAFGDFIAEAKIEGYKNTNEELKTLIELAERGGNLKELSKLYEERQTVLETDVTTEEGQVDIVKKYYKSIGKSAEKQALRETKEIEKKEKERIEKIRNFGNVLVKKGINQKAASSAVDFVYKEAYKSPDGITLSAFDKKLIDVKSNPEELMELVQFLVDKDKYISLKTAQISTKKTESTFSNILKSQVNKKTGSVVEEKQISKVKPLSYNEFFK